MTEKIKVILWDFDGVILDSMAVRDFGFTEIFKTFNQEDVDKLINYHRLNGGLSRYVKIRYFYEEILSKDISEAEVNQYADQFSVIMKQKLIDTNNLISDSLDFINKEHKNYKFHIVSGSDQEELRYLCKELGIDHLFLSIHGSPTPKKQLVADLMNTHKYVNNETCLIGDSVNDYEAAIHNNIDFYGYNNIKLKDINEKYIEQFKTTYVFNK